MWYIFKSRDEKIAALADERDELEFKINLLRTDHQQAKDELSDLKQERKVADEDIRHMVKLKEERMDLDFEKRVVVIEKDQAAAIAAVKDMYQDKQLAALENQIERTEVIQKEILDRLPNIAVKINGKLD